MKNYKSVIAGCLITLGILGSSCDSCDFVVLADLVAKAIIVPEQITFGETALAVLEITNERDDGECGENTLDAGESLYLWQLFKWNNSSNDWDSVEGDEEFQSSLLANQDKGNPINMTVNAPGRYKLDGLTDSPNVVEERSETNNDEEEDFEPRSSSTQYNVEARVELLKNNVESNNYASVEFVVDESGKVLLIQ